MSVSVELAGSLAQHHYKLTDAPATTAIRARQVEIAPTEMCVHVVDGRPYMVSIGGATIRRDGVVGAHREATWVAAESWRDMPEWLAEIVTGLGFTL